MTREPSFEFETDHKGRAGIVGYTRAINYYIVNNGHDVPASFVSYDERKKGGVSLGFMLQLFRIRYITAFNSLEVQFALHSDFVATLNLFYCLYGMCALPHLC